MSYDVVVIVPVLRRPHRVQPLLDSLAATTDRCRVLYVCTDDDQPQVARVRAAAHTYDHVDVETIAPNRVGDYAIKINHGYRMSNEPLMFLGADDLAFHPGWLEAAEARMADPAVAVVGTQDLGNRRVKVGLHATHSLVRRSYVDECGTIDEAGKVLHEGYVHEFVDDEFVETARRRGVFAFAHDSVVEHLHPSWGKAPSDDLYRAEPGRMRAGHIVFRERRPLWMT